MLKETSTLYKLHKKLQQVNQISKSVWNFLPDNHLRTHFSFNKHTIYSIKSHENFMSIINTWLLNGKLSDCLYSENNFIRNFFSYTWIKHRKCKYFPSVFHSSISTSLRSSDTVTITGGTREEWPREAIELRAAIAISSAFGETTAGLLLETSSDCISVLMTTK